MTSADTRDDMVDAHALLSFLALLKEGDFTARLPVHWPGLAGKVADGFNEISTVNQAFCAELAPKIFSNSATKILSAFSANCTCGLTKSRRLNEPLALVEPMDAARFCNCMAFCEKLMLAF